MQLPDGVVDPLPNYGTYSGPVIMKNTNGTDRIVEAKNVPKTRRNHIVSEQLRGSVLTFMATTFLLADPYIWVGMIMKQNSPLHESIVALMTSIFFCRLAQLAASFFVIDMVSEVDDPKIVKHGSDNNYTYERFLFIFGQLTSLCFLVLSLCHFCSASGFVFSLSHNGLNLCFGIQAAFVCFVCFFELLKHIISFLYMAGPQIQALHWYALYLDTDRFWTWWVALYWCDIVYRVIFVFVTIGMVASSMSNLNSTLTTFLALSSL